MWLAASVSPPTWPSARSATAAAAATLSEARFDCSAMLLIEAPSSSVVPAIAWMPAEASAEALVARLRLAPGRVGDPAERCGGVVHELRLAIDLVHHLNDVGLEASEDFAELALALVLLQPFLLRTRFQLRPFDDRLAEGDDGAGKVADLVLAGERRNLDGEVSAGKGPDRCNHPRQRNADAEIGEGRDAAGEDEHETADDQRKQGRRGIELRHVLTTALQLLDVGVDHRHEQRAILVVEFGEAAAEQVLRTRRACRRLESWKSSSWRVRSCVKLSPILVKLLRFLDVLRDRLPTDTRRTASASRPRRPCCPLRRRLSRRRCRREYARLRARRMRCRSDCIPSALITLGS